MDRHRGCSGRVALPALLRALAIALAVASGTTARLAGAVPEIRLKAALISKLPQFVEWPSAALDGRASLDICVARPNPFGADLEELLAGEQLNQRALVLRQVATAADVDGCHLLYLPAYPAGVHPLLRVAASRPVLTVSDAPDFLDNGGIVALRVVSGRLRFDIDAAASRRVGLRISSQLLGLAVSVRGGLA